MTIIENNIKISLLELSTVKLQLGDNAKQGLFKEDSLQVPQQEIPLSNQHHNNIKATRS